MSTGAYPVGAFPDGGGVPDEPGSTPGIFAIPRRLFTVSPETRFFTVTVDDTRPTSFSIVKDPQAVLDYGAKWSSWLGLTDLIIDSIWEVAGPDASLVIDSQNFSPTETGLWLSGGTVGGKYTLTNHILTTEGRKDDRSFAVTIQQRLASYSPIKDPEAVLDYGGKWDSWLGLTDTIATSAWAVTGPDSSLVIESDDNSLTIVALWLSGGTPGAKYTVTNHLVTTEGREDDRGFTVTMQHR